MRHNIRGEKFTGLYVVPLISGVFRVISTSPEEAQPVFDTIVGERRHAM